MLAHCLRRWPNLKPALHECVVFDLYPENTRHGAIGGLMLGHRLRRWPNIDPTLAQCIS